jgi:hypothetical protein
VTDNNALNVEFELARRLLQNALNHLFDNFDEGMCDWEEINPVLEVIRDARIRINDFHGIQEYSYEN